jgi:hypothetical protein
MSTVNGEKSGGQRATQQDNFIISNTSVNRFSSRMHMIRWGEESP